MKKTRILMPILTITLALSLALLIADTPSASANTIILGKKTKNLDVELSPPKSLFHPDEDGYFYPGRPKITKKLILRNVGDVPFRICNLNATFYGDSYLATGLQIEILEVGKGKGEKPHLLCNGTLNNLSEGVEVNGKRAISQGKSVTLQITVWMPETAGNEYQGLTMTADIAITVRFPPASDGGNN